jgi:hypothetical protein
MLKTKSAVAAAAAVLDDDQNETPWKLLNTPCMN